MSTYEIKFSVNGKVTLQNVTANTSIDAKKVIEVQYKGAKIVYYSVTKK